MRRTNSRALGVLVLLACMPVYVLAALIFFMTRGGSPNQAATPDQILCLFIQLGAFAAFPVIGGLIVSQRPSNTVGWIFCAIGLGTAFTSFSAGYIQHALTTHADTQLATGLVDAVGNAVWILNLGLGSLLLSVFPDGKPLRGPWRVIFWATVAAVAATVLASVVQPGPLETGGRVVNPLGIAALDSVLSAIDTVGHFLFIPLVLVAVASVIVRYRRAEGVQRQQIKWFAYGAGLLVLVIAVTLVASDALTPAGQNPSNSVISNVGFSLAFVMLPLGAGIGVLRYRLYDIDVLINRTLVYGSLTLALAAVYVASVALMQALASRLTGQHALPPAAVVVSTLLIAALFSPLRRRLQRFIDRRFYRARYDTARTLERFAATLRSEVDLRDLSDHLVGVVDETMCPAHLSLWLRPHERVSGQQRGEGAVP
jgi:hypothetical protein